MDPNPRQSALQRISGATNILVTVSTNPSVDQLAAAIGFTLFLNKIGKHGTAVFSGKVPSTLEFLKPEETIEKNTDSLRDFIIALDKSKADKLRYKVEDTYVKIFITPYKTTLSQADLEFSQGDFNVDVVVALGVHNREELDNAITAHGRILHDAAVISVNNQDQSDLGAINWNEPDASSLCEMIVGLCDTLQANSMDSQIATSFLTGIVAQTDRFGNQRTTAKTMTVSAELIAAGANQQLVASKLDQEEELKLPKTPQKAAPPKAGTNGTLKIEHPEPATTKVAPPKKKEEAKVDPDQIHIDERGTLHYTKDLANDKENLEQNTGSGYRNNYADSVNGRLVSGSNDSNTVKEPTAIDQQLLSYGSAPSGPSLNQIQKSLDSATPPPVNDAREAVENAVKKSPEGPLPPKQSIGAQFVHLDDNTPATEKGPADNPKPVSPLTDDSQPGPDVKTPPPPVPPPMMPPFMPPSPPRDSGKTGTNADGTISGAPL